MNRLPLIVAIVLLLLPVLYLGSYFALVTPSGSEIVHGYVGAMRYPKPYRLAASWCERIFWPLELVHRSVRPGAWDDEIRLVSP